MPSVVQLGALTAVVVDWNLPDHTIRSVRSLVEDGVPPERIVIVENGSSDDCWGQVAAALSSCVLVRLDRNVGFARANNIGAGVLPGSAYLFVNNDAFVRRPGSVAMLLGALERPRAGMVVPRLLNEDLTLQPIVVPFTTPVVALVRASGLSRFLPNRWQPRWSTHWDHSSSREIEAAIGAVILVRGEIWEALGGFREASFMYAEDIDLCWSARDCGWATWFEHAAEFVHLGGASSGTRWSVQERAERVGRAEAETIRQHLSPARAAATLALMRIGVGVRSACFRLIRNDVAAASCRGYFRGYGMPPDRRDESGVGPRVGQEIGPGVEVVCPSMGHSRRSS